MNRLSLLLVIWFLALSRADAQEGTRRVGVLKYPDCIELSNETTVVVLGHHVGGRVLKYAHKGKEALWLNPKEAEWKSSKRRMATAGRFDIGPELLIPRRDVLWSGAWKAEITGPRAARLTSAEDKATGVQLIREFVLAADSSHLQCKQIIRNVSSEEKRWCHWSRTFAIHGGIAIVPLTPSKSKFPNGYVMYETGTKIDFRPKDPKIRARGNFLEVLAPPKHPKLGMDSFAGWFAYQMPNDLLFVKKYRTFPGRPYNEVAGLTISIWYPEKERVPACELEPIGPANEIAPGGSAEFTEHWWLLEHPFPGDGADFDLERVASKAELLKTD